MGDLDELISRAQADIGASSDLASLDQVRVRLLGKKGELTIRLKQLGSLPKAERPAAGEAINQAKQALTENKTCRALPWPDDRQEYSAQ